jgi:glutamine synthetase
MSSGWHLHQSLLEAKSKLNAFMRETPEANTNIDDARHTLSDVGTHYLAGLLNNAQGMTVMCTPTVNGFGRFRPNALAPQSILWGRDNRGAMLRVIGQAGDTATRIENRLGEPAANPYLYMASQIHAGLQGMQDKLVPPLATDSPYGDASEALNDQAVRIPNHLGDALNALQNNGAMREGFGAEFLRYYARIKSSEQQRFDASEDKLEFQKREYFSRI